MKLRLDEFEYDIQLHEYDVQLEQGAVVVDGQRFPVSVKGTGLTRTVTVGGRSLRVDLSEPTEDGTRTANVDGRLWLVRSSGGAHVAPPPHRAELPAHISSATAQRPARTAGTGAVAAQMTGRILRIEVAPGDEVQEGALLLVLEAMKMENEIRSPRSGKVKAVAVNVGDRVNTGDPLMEFET
jgi:biotin carboxyl carrier protein